MSKINSTLPTLASQAVETNVPSVSDACPPTLRAALEYAQRGWRVLPVFKEINGKCSCRYGMSCTSPGKHPATRHGVKDATSDPVEIMRLFGDRDYNIGVAMGRTLCAIDVDASLEGNVKKTVEEIVDGHVETLTAKTRRGVHLYYAVEPGRVVPSVRLSDDPPIELIGQGKYAIVPPSQHRVWIIKREPLPLPDGIWQLIKLKTNNGHARLTNPNGMASILRGVPRGQRNVAAARVAGRLLQCLPPAEAWTLLCAWNAQNRPPLPERELRRVFRSIWLREARRRYRSLDIEAVLARAVRALNAHHSQREIAKALGISQATVSRLRKAHEI